MISSRQVAVDRISRSIGPRPSRRKESYRILQSCFVYESNNQDQKALDSGGISTYGFSSPASTNHEFVSGLPGMMVLLSFGGVRDVRVRPRGFPTASLKESKKLFPVIDSMAYPIKMYAKFEYTGVLNGEVTERRERMP